MILTQSQIALENCLRRILPAGVVSLWVPNGYGGATDLIRGNHGTCFGTHPNVPVISTFQPPNILTDGGLELWTSATNLTHWTESLAGTSTINREATEKIEGDYSCRLDVDALNSGTYFYQVDRVLTPSKRYKLVIWYKNSIAGKTAQTNFFNMASNVFLKEDGTWNVGAYPIVLPNSLVWTLYEIEFHAHPDYSNYRLNLTRSSAASSSIYFDNVSLKEFKPSLINPSVGWVFGGDDYIDCGNDKSLNIDTAVKQWTMGAWINPLWFKDPLGDAAAILWRNYNYGIRLEDSGRIYAYIRDTVSWKSVYKVGYGPYNYYFVAGILNGSRLSLCVNGVEVAFIDDVGAIATPTGNFLIGSQLIVTNKFKGSGVFPFIANKAWSQQQVNNFYQATKGMFAPRG